MHPCHESGVGSIISAETIVSPANQDEADTKKKGSSTYSGVNNHQEGLHRLARTHKNFDPH
jgi:hypothetical protein